jgi:hypothetical protein
VTGPRGPTGLKGETGGNWVNPEVQEFNITGDTGPAGGSSGPTGPTATNPPYIAALTLGTGEVESLPPIITSTGPQTASFLLLGPTMSPPNEESLLIQGISLDRRMCASLESMTGFYNGTSFEIKANYTILNFSAGRPPSFPFIPTNICYYGTYNFTTLP